MSRLAEEGSLGLLTPPPLFPEAPALPVFLSPFSFSLSAVQQGRPHLGEDWKGYFSSFHS